MEVVCLIGDQIGALRDAGENCYSSDALRDIQHGSYTPRVVLMSVREVLSATAPRSQGVLVMIDSWDAQGGAQTDFQIGRAHV